MQIVYQMLLVESVNVGLDLSAMVSFMVPNASTWTSAFLDSIDCATKMRSAPTLSARMNALAKKVIAWLQSPFAIRHAHKVSLQHKSVSDVCKITLAEHSYF